MPDKYDSRQDTIEHITKVRELIELARKDLARRAREHDASKLQSPEKPIFDVVTPKLRGLTYGSPEYKASLAEMGPALMHHYEHNSHHPEHYPGGIADMSLLDVIEMVCDWRAATQRHADGDFGKSLIINRDRFGIQPQVFDMLVNTARAFGWISKTWKPDE